MKRFGLAICLISAMAAGCDDDNPTGPSNTAVFTAQLSSANENPPISNAEQGANGTGVITFTLTRDSGGTITAATVNFHATLQGFTNGSSAILAHIHPGATGVNGPVLINSTLSAATAVVMPNGTGTLDITSNVSNPGAIQAIIDNPAGYYYNIHTVLNGGGAVRGQLLLQ